MRLLLKIMFLLALVLGLGFRAASALTFGVAGVPMELGQTRDYDRIFAQLSANGVDLFFPVFQFVEAPEPQSLGFEVDFVPPCRPDDPAFAAMRHHGIKLIAPGNLLYPEGRFPPLADDPLAALIACAGREHVFGVLSFDEPVQNGLSIRATRGLYERVKAVAPDMPVLMVHAPLVIEEGKHDTQAARESYLAQVAKQSRYADIVGFSTYPIPPMVAKMGAPGQGDSIVDHVTAAREYVAWLRAALPDKQVMAVLQNFNYADQYSPALLAVVATPDLIAMVNAPTARELEDMARTSVAAGADLVIWYGAGFTKPADARSWRDTLSVSRRLAGQR
jgi:hypothetical protein